jgi:hypothetical protein
MKRPILAAALLPLLALSAYSQRPRASLRGLVSYPDGSPVPNAPIQVKHQTNGAVARTRSEANGHYNFSALAEGKWDFTIRMPCCAYSAVASEVVVARDKTQQFDVRLVETINGGTLGDDPARNADAMRKRQRVLPAPQRNRQAALAIVNPSGRYPGLSLSQITVWYFPGGSRNACSQTFSRF